MGTYSCRKIGMSVAGPDNCNGSNRDVTRTPGPHRLGVTRQAVGENNSKTQRTKDSRACHVLSCILLGMFINLVFFICQTANYKPVLA